MHQEIIELINLAIAEDFGDGDHTTLACVPKNKIGKAKLIAKEKGIIAGIDLGKFIFEYIDPTAQVTSFKNDGDGVEPGDVIMQIEGKEQLLLQSERLVLNFMQRMSGIATLTARFKNEIKDQKTQLLDTRKTTPGLRKIEKMAVKIGGGQNHRMGLYDMILLKENHIDYAGGIELAIKKCQAYLDTLNKEIPIEIETRNLDELSEVLRIGNVDRIMLDNFSLSDLKKQ
mgnify:CR=1 FL=1